MDDLTRMQGYQTALHHLHVELAAPPPGWFVFGHHIGQDIELEFWGDDGGGLPIWERPKSERDEDAQSLAQKIANARRLDTSGWRGDPPTSGDIRIAKAILEGRI